MFDSGATLDLRLGADQRQAPKRRPRQFRAWPLSALSGFTLPTRTAQATAKSLPRKPPQLAEPGDLVDVLVRAERLYFAAPGAAAAVGGAVTCRRSRTATSISTSASPRRWAGDYWCACRTATPGFVGRPARVGIAVSGEQAIAFLRL
jgi:hypothetical protein